MANKNQSETDTPRIQASFSEIAKTYLQFSRGIWKFALPTLVFLCLDGLIESRIPAILKYVLDGLMEDTDAFVSQKLLKVGVGLAAMSVVWFFVAFIQHYLTTKVSSTMTIRVQLGLYAHLQKLGLDFYHRTQVGEITARLTGDVRSAVHQLFHTATFLVWALSLLIPSAITMAKLSKPLFLVFLGITALFVFISKLFLPTLRDRQRAVQDQYGRISARMTEDISSLSLIKSYAREELAEGLVSSDCDLYLKRELRNARLQIVFGDFIEMFVNYLAPFAILCIGAWLTRTGMGIGTLVAFFTYWKIVSSPVSSIVSIFPQLFSAFASFDRILEFFRETPLVEDHPGSGELSVDKGEIAFSRVTFEYPAESGEIVLNDISFAAEAHKSLAIVGESGAGKSTITNLVLRFYDPLTGSVRIDGTDIREYQQKSLREQIGLVMQDTILLSGSIRHNMRYAKPDASDEEIITALDSAEAWSFIEEMPQQLDTVLGERGVRLSGGQKQRLSIARVFLKNPPIVVFDEATSALDTITEKQIQETMSKLFRNRTSIVIAHRLSTIVNCDKIMLLDKGKVAAIGSHASLLDTSPMYRKLCQKQDLGKQRDVT